MFPALQAKDFFSWSLANAGKGPVTVCAIMVVSHGKLPRTRKATPPEWLRRLPASLRLRAAHAVSTDTCTSQPLISVYQHGTADSTTNTLAPLPGWHPFFCYVIDKFSIRPRIRLGKSLGSLALSCGSLPSMPSSCRNPCSPLSPCVLGTHTQSARVIHIDRRSAPFIPPHCAMPLWHSLPTILK